MSKTYVLFIIKILEIRGKRDMKKLLYFAFFSFFAFFGTVNCETETLNWIVDGQTYTTTTCESGGDVILPPTPTKPGYTFVGWEHYTPVEYLTSTGTQYIDTGYVPKIGTKMEVRVKILNDSGNKAYASLASVAVGGSSYFSALLVSSGRCVGYAGGWFVTISCNTNDIVTGSIDIGNGSAQIVQYNETKDNTVNYTRSVMFTPSLSVPLFAEAGDNGVATYGIASMYYAKIWEWGELIHNYIPIIDINGTPCMYDTVTSEYLYNSGTGDFVAGPVISGE